MRKFWVLAVLICGAVYAFAGPSQTTFSLLQFNGGNWENGYPYYGAEDGNSTVPLWLMCDDYAHGGSPGQSWQAYVTDLGGWTFEDNSYTRFANPATAAGYGNYRLAGWILLQTLDTQSNQWLDMNEAVWHIFDPNAPIDSGGLEWIVSAQAQARLGFPDTDFNKVYIVTPTNVKDPDPNSIQEFMFIGNDPTSSSGGPAGTTPEPASLVLLGSGALAMFARRFWN